MPLPETADDGPGPEPDDDLLEDAGPDDSGYDDTGRDDTGRDDAEPEDTEPDDEPAAPWVASRRGERPRPAPRRASARRVQPTSSGTNRRWGRVRVTSRDHVDLLVLLSLRRGPADGRGVVARLRECSDGQLDAPERTIHVTLHRLARNRLLGRRLDPASGRRLYALTEAGERATRARLREWHALARGVDAVARAGG